MRDLTQNVGNVLTIQHQTCVDEIFKCTIFVGYGGVIFFLPVFHLEGNFFLSRTRKSLCDTFSPKIQDT